jgi:ABC-2 type transport system ATP-binding protein
VSAPAVEVQGTSLAYRLSRSDSGTAKEFVIQLMKRQVSYEQLWALKDVSFTVSDGEVLGVVGPNGAGKSTLMKMLARVLPPTKGRIVVRGSVAPMIELGAGFNPELTGIENIVMYGTLLGRSPQVMRERADAIAEWASLSDYLDVPIRSYSSGMLARLGFSVATDIEPDVLIVDEVLSVGDAAFQQKSSNRMRSMIANGASVVLVSHNLDTVRAIADRAIWLDSGAIVLEGDPEEVVGEYERSVS